MNNIQIALDGPSGAGKSTMAKHIANALDILYLDTGAMYRAVAYTCLQKGVDVKEAAPVSTVMQQMVLEVQYLNHQQHILVNGEDISNKIRTNDISMAASTVSAHPVVREKLVAMQQQIAQNQSLIMDGRDIGTKVLPMATVKIFLTATTEDRAKRRYKELLEKGLQDKSYEEVLQEIRKRDAQDTGRTHSPLVQADDAICVNTSGLTLEEGMDKLLQLVRKGLAHAV